MADLQNDMPPGWDCKKDENTGRCYYINHYTRTTTWEDPRNRHRPFQGTPKQPEYIPLQDMRTKMSPLTVRSAKIQDISLLVTDTDESVAKIAAMFPTVPETHVRMLLKNCRYMKSVFPQADETIILDILQNNENNIQKTTEALKDMGFEKKDTVKAANVKQEAKREEERQEAASRIRPVTPIPVVKTIEEKRIMKEELQEKYKDVPEHLISIALESVNFDESRANQILQIMLKEDTNTTAATKSTENEVAVVDIADCPSTSRAPSFPVSQSRQSLKSLLKVEKELDKTSYSRVIEDEEDMHNKSQYLSDTKGPNSKLAKGANDTLLLEDYVKWLGPNPSLRKGPQGLAKGPCSSLLSTRSYRPCGPNSDIRKGSKFSLAKGSIFSGIASIVVGESRGN